MHRTISILLLSLLFIFSGCERLEGLFEGRDDDKEEFCFEFVYPISLTMPDGLVVTVDDEEDFDSQIKDWYEDNEKEETEPELHYPLEVIMADRGSGRGRDRDKITINSAREMKRVYESCDKEEKDEKGRDKDEKEGDDEESCYEMVYPLTYVMPDGTAITGNSEREIDAAISKWYEENPNSNERPALQFPIEIVLKDGGKITVNSQEELEQACD